MFTGWKIVGAGGLIWALQSMVWVQGYGNLAVELRNRFGWSKTFFSLAFAATRTEGALIGPAQGNALSRFGTRRIMRVGAVIVAGILHFVHTHEETLEAWNRVLTINLTGTFLMCRAALPHLLATRGTIVNMSSTAALKAHAWPSAYWGSLPLEGGIEAAYRAEIDAAADPAAKLKEIEDRLNKLRSPFRSAEKFWVEEVIDPRIDSHNTIKHAGLRIAIELQQHFGNRHRDIDN